MKLTDAQRDRLTILGALTQLPEADQAKVHATAAKIRADMAEAGEFGKIALGLVGLDLQIAEGL